MDETYEGDAAAAEGITTLGTAFLMLTLTKQGTIDVDDGRTVIDSMVDEGWYCAPNGYTNLLQKLEEISE